MFIHLLACPAPEDGNDKVVPDESGSETAETGDSGESTPAREGDTVGPDLPACTAASGAGDLVALSGVVLSQDGPVAGTLVYSRRSGLVECVGDCDTTGADVVCTEGIISAGLVDPHNHLQYNTLPPWEVDPEFEDRYEWQQDDRYDDYKTGLNGIKDAYGCEIMKWAEAREVVHGTTAAVGSYGGDCMHLLLRNLDEDSTSSHLSGYSLDYSSGNVTNMDEGEAEDARSDLANGSLDAVINHVAEGKDGSVRDEADYMQELGMTGPGQVWVHATDLTTGQLAQMAVDGTGIIWSPRSNLALYATTTPIEIADALGVPWAIGTDWTPSGSMAPVGELACAAEWLHTKGDPLSDVELYAKATTDAARMVGLDGVLGALIVGQPADLAVFDWSSTPYRKVIDAQPEDVSLVVVAGEAVYGETDTLVSLAANPDWCDSLDVCGESRSFCLKAEESGDDAQTLDEVQTALAGALALVNMPSGYAYAGELFDLWECEPSRDACDLSAPADGDEDGDGVADDGDVCTGVYDPNQWDTDGDGVGDSCDPCPLEPDATDCAASAADVDGDGVENEADNCTYVANADQADEDGDGVGDACDATAMTVTEAREADAGTYAEVAGLVVTAVREGSGFAAQDPALDAYAGIWVYDSGGNAVEVGDVVTVTGTLSDYYGWREFEGAVAVVTDTAEVPDPVEVADACDIGTGGSLADALQSMLVSVADVTVTDANPDDPEDFDEVVLDDCLRMDDYFWEELDQPEVGTAYASVTGIAITTWDNAKIAPRGSEDLVE